MRAAAILFMVALLICAAFDIGFLEQQRDAAIQRAEIAEANAAELLDLLNGHSAMIEVQPNGARIYTVFKTRKITVNPIVMAEAQ